MNSRSFDRQGARAVYGSTDRAVKDHSNDTLCKLASASAHFTSDPRYTGEVYPHDVHRYAGHDVITESVPEIPSEEQVNIWIKRAIKAGMTVVDYCARIGVAL